MGDWLHNLPIGWMALLVFGATYPVAAPGAHAGILCTENLRRGGRKKQFVTPETRARYSPAQRRRSRFERTT